LVRVNGLPNQPACRLLVEGGEQIETQNVLGTRETDLLAAADFLFPQGIDHHRLMAGIRGISPLVGNFARRIAGLGRLADGAPAVRPAQRREIPLLIVGGGRAGLTAAARLGPRATLVDDGHTLGGALTALEPKRAEALAATLRASGADVHPHASVLALSREPDDGTGRISALVVTAAKTLLLRCQAVLLATGRHDATPAFANNDLPGIFSARAALFAWQNDVLIGSRIGVVGSGRYAARLLEQVQGAAALVPLDAESVLRAIGRERISGVEIRTDDGTRRIKAECFGIRRPGSTQLRASRAGGRFGRFRRERRLFSARRRARAGRRAPVRTRSRFGGDARRHRANVAKLVATWPSVTRRCHPIVIAVSTKRTRGARVSGDLSARRESRTC
jgi:sarcosine oxidase, subunit alpha